MAEAGGASTNAGVRYQNAVTGLWLAYMLDGSKGVIAVRPETPFLRRVADHAPERAFVDDIRIDREGSTSIYCQVKISASSGRWTWRDLTEQEDERGDPRNVWQQFYWQFASAPDDDLQFWTAQGADDPKELCERAKSHDSLDEFESSLSQELQALFASLQSRLTEHGSTPGIPAERTWQFLRRLDFLQRDQATVEELARATLRPIVGSNAVDTAWNALFIGSINAASQRAVITRLKLVELLRPIGVVELAPDNVEQLVQRANAITDGALSAIDDSIPTPAGRWHRTSPSEAEVLRLLRGPDEAGLLLLLDEPGAGKSAILKRVARALLDEGIVVIAIDVRNYPFADTRQRLSSDLGFSSLLPTVLASIATEHHVVFIADGLDGLASRASVLDMFVGLLTDCGSLPRVQVLAASRSFEARTTRRLRELRDANRQLTLVRWQDEDVLRGLAALGLSSVQPPRVVSLFRLPVLLKFLAEAIEVRGSIPIPDTATAVYDIYWQARVELDEQDDETSLAQRTNAVFAVAERMVDEQRYVLNRDSLIELEPAASSLARRGVLRPTADGRGLTFLRQTMLDYAAARRFGAQSASLVDWVGRREQRLFLRPIVRQILQDLRTQNAPRYIREVAPFLASPDVRTHLKVLALEFVARQQPEFAEVTMVEKVLGNSPQLLSFFLEALPSASWAQPLLSLWRGLVRGEQGGDLRRLTFLALEQMAAESPQVVITLLFDALDAGGDLDMLAFWESTVSKQLGTWTDPRQPELLTKLAATGDRRWVPEVLSLAATANANLAPLASQILLQYLESTPPDTTAGKELSDEIAKASQELAELGRIEFARGLIPLVGLNTRRHRPSTFSGAPESGLIEDYSTYRIEHLLPPEGRQPVNLVQLLAIAIARAQHTGGFADTVVRILSSQDAVVRRVGLEMLQPERWGAELAQAISDPDTLASDSLRFAVARLIPSLFPFLDPAARERILEVVIDLPSRASKPGHLSLSEWRESISSTQLLLLQAIPKDLQSGAAETAIAHLEESAHAQLPQAPQPSRVMGGWAIPPVPREQLISMSAEELANLAKDWPMDRQEERIYGHGFITGGPRELAAAIADVAKHDVNRAHSVLRALLSDGVDPTYAEYLLNGINGAHRSTDQGDQPLASASGRSLLASEVDEKAPCVVLRAVVALIAPAMAELSTDALEHPTRLVLAAATCPDPTQDAKYDTADGALTAAINTARGTAAEALPVLAYHTGDERVWTTIERLASDQTEAVRSGIVSNLAFAAERDRSRAHAAFRQAAGAHGPGVLHAALWYLDNVPVSEYESDVRPWLNAMLQQGMMIETRTRGAELAARFVLRGSESSLLNSIVSTESQREVLRGAIRQLGENLDASAVGMIAGEWLQRIVDERSENGAWEDVAMALFGHGESLSVLRPALVVLGRYGNPSTVSHLLDAVESAYEDAPTLVLDVLEVTLARPDIWSESPLANASEPYRIVREALTDEEHEHQALNLVDRAIELRLPGFRTLLRALDAS